MRSPGASGKKRHGDIRDGMPVAFTERAYPEQSNRLRLVKAAVREMNTVVQVPQVLAMRSVKALWVGAHAGADRELAVQWQSVLVVMAGGMQASVQPGSKQ